MRIAITVITTVIIILLCLLLFAVSGRYPIGADIPHWPMVENTIAWARQKSVARAAADIKVPDDLDDPARLSSGGAHYEAMCAGCHGAPSEPVSEIRQGLYPQPPDLTQHGIHDPAEAFWVIKHGIKLTAMPAWGKTHDDQSLWDLVAFARQLPKLDAGRYAELTEEADGHTHAGEHSHKGADHSQSHDSGPALDQHPAQEHKADDHGHDHSNHPH